MKFLEKCLMSGIYGNSLDIMVNPLMDNDSGEEKPCSALE